MSALALPSNRDEAWRWSDLSALPELAERQPLGIVPDSLPWLDCGTESPRLLFVDGAFVPEKSRLGPIVFGPVEGVDHPLASLAGREGWVLELGRDQAPAGLVEIVHVATGGADHLPARIALGDDAQASIVETFIGAGWTNRFTRIALGKGARLMLARRVLNESGFVSLTGRAEIGQGASLVETVLAAGGADTRLDGMIALGGAGAFAESGGALLARFRQRHDVNVVIRHDAPSGTSRQVWRSVADDRAATSVAARVEVARDAQKTDAAQSLKGLLLSASATVNSKPELEIFADDVKCAHGASVGALDRDALFYLASRGLPAPQARALLTRAFVADAIDRIGKAEARTAFEADAEAWFG
jgi:Fe-S cluster assembly protein SufD